MHFSLSNIKAFFSKNKDRFLKPKRFILNFKELKCLLTLKGWGQFFKILTKKERIAFFSFLCLFFTSSLFLLINFYYKNTEIKPAKGGLFIEGVVGQPRWIQPIYAPTNDVDKDLTELVYAGLMKYDENGKIVPDLVKNFPKISEDGKEYEFDLKENIFWQDGKPITSDDVIFTINVIQNADYKSPLRISWLGVETEKISDSVFRLKLKNPYNSFLETTTLKILPKHIWQNISPENFPLSFYNLKPIGSGPFKLKEIKKRESGEITSIELVRNLNYHGKIPYLDKIYFYFFETEDDLIKAVKNKKTQGFALNSINLNLKEKGFLDYHLFLPRYFSVFFNLNNQNNEFTKEIRQALNYGTDKKEILEKVFSGQGKVINSPLLPEFYGLNESSFVYDFNIEKAKEILEKAGFVETENGQRKKVIKNEIINFTFKSTLKVGSKGKEVEQLQKCLSQFSDIYPDGQITGVFGEKTKTAVINFQKKFNLKETGNVGSSTREKLNEVCFAPSEKEKFLKFSLTTVNQPTLLEVASILKNQWQKLGVEVEIKKIDPSNIEEVIKKRDYEMLLFGEIFGALPDPFPFWHSSQKKDPGLNLSSYENKDVDKLLEEARQTLDESKRKEDLEKIQNILMNDAPAIFLYNQDYIYFVSEKIKGIKTKMIVDPSERFSGIENWYINIKRAWK